MRTPFQLHLELDILAAVKAYAAEQRISITRLISEVLCQFLGLKGLLDPVLKAAIEERIERGAGRPVDPERKRVREEAAKKEQERVYAEAGVRPMRDGLGNEIEVTEPRDETDEDRALKEEISRPMFAPTETEEIPNNPPPNPGETFEKPEDYKEAFKNEPTPPTGPPIFNPEIEPSRNKDQPLNLDKQNTLGKICLRCMEVVAKCECVEGPEEG